MYQKGVTLFELIFALAIIACISVFAMQDNALLHKKNELSTLKQNLSTALRYAKLAALTQEKGICLRPLDAENWALGVAIYTYKDHALLYQWNWKYPNWEIYWQGFSSNKQLLIASSPQNSASNGQFILLHKPSQEKVHMQVNRLGRIM